MPEYPWSGRKKDSKVQPEGTPKEAYDAYRKEYPNDNKEPRKISKDISDNKIKPTHIGKKSIEVKKQELVSHLQNFQETFNSVQYNIWKAQAEHLLNQINIS